MATESAAAAEGPRETFFAATDQLPEAVRYRAAMGAIGISAILKVPGKDHWALFVGQWPLTFLILAIFHKVLRPGR